MATERDTIAIPTPAGGWGVPWPNVAEIADVMPHTSWTLVGGLMTQLHAIAHGLPVVRPTNDVDIVLHVETTRGVAIDAAVALERLGYTLADSFDPRTGTAHRFRRGSQSIDLVATGPEAGDVVDVLIADHAAPSRIPKLRGRPMVAIEGGTQALRRTVNATLDIQPDKNTTLSVPSVFGALILKAAAAMTDSRDPARHLTDAVALLACLDDPFAARQAIAGSDRHRLMALDRALATGPRPWGSLDPEHRLEAHAALRILISEP